MSLNYQKALPRDSGTGEAMQAYPAPRLSLREIVSENAATSSVVTLNDNTTAIEVTAVGSTGFIKWIPTTNTNPSVISAAGTADYDHVIPAGTVRRFVVPQESIGVSSMSGANVMNGCYQRVAWKTGGIGSILSSEF